MTDARQFAVEFFRKWQPIINFVVPTEMVADLEERARTAITSSAGRIEKLKQIVKEISPLLPLLEREGIQVNPELELSDLLPVSPQPMITIDANENRRIGSDGKDFWIDGNKIAPPIIFRGNTVVTVDQIAEARRLDALESAAFDGSTGTPPSGQAGLESTEGANL